MISFLDLFLALVLSTITIKIIDRAYYLVTDMLALKKCSYNFVNRDEMMYLSDKLNRLECEQAMARISNTDEAVKKKLSQCGAYSDQTEAKSLGLSTLN